MTQEDQIRKAMLKDLELQWHDHFHMRDQTWKTLTNSALLFLGVIGLEIKDVGNFVMIPAYIVVVLTAAFGWIVATHHRIRQGQKFAFIKMYEDKLGLYEYKKEIINKGNIAKGLVSKIFTAGFIRFVHLGFGFVALILLIRRIFTSA